jgi:hypothetical protein
MMTNAVSSAASSVPCGNGDRESSGLFRANAIRPRAPAGIEVGCAFDSAAEARTNPSTPCGMAEHADGSAGNALKLAPAPRHP